MNDYRVEFVVKTGLEPDMGGFYVVSGDKYHIMVESARIISDGKSRWEVNGQNDEVIIDKVDPKDRNILSNPTRAFEFLDGGFTHTYIGTVVYNGRRCEQIVLVPQTAQLAAEDITLYIDIATGLPAGLKYTVDGLSSPIEIVVNSFRAVEKPDPALFVFDKSEYTGYEIIDFRR